MNKLLLPKLKDIFTIHLNGKGLLALLLVMFLSSVLLAQQPARKPNNGTVLTKVDGHDAGIDAMLKKYDKQIYFTQNKGQWPSGVLYKADFTYGQAVATPNGMLVSSFDPASVGARSKWVMDQEEAQHDGRVFTTPMPDLKGHAWTMNFVGSSPAMTMSDRDGHSDAANYFIGSDPSKYATNVKSFDEVWYNNVYTNVDVRYYPSAEGALEYDIIVKPGANTTDIKVKFDGIDNLELVDGHLVLNTSVGKMDLPQPYAYQTINGKEIKIDAAYALNDKNELTFELGKYNTSLPLIIDPIAMRWATWITNNSASDNHGHCIWVDPAGNIYVVSRFSGAGLITTPGAFSVNPIGALDLNVGKYTEPATVGGAGVRVWQTYLGGAVGDENPYVAEMGSDGNLYIAGYTTSTDFPIAGNGVFSGSGLDKRTEDGQNTFVLKIDPLGTSIKGAVLGGSIAGNTSSSDDNVVDLRITPTGFLILGGYTSATNLATNYASSGASNTANGGTDFWMFKLNQNLDAVSWMKNWGGPAADQINILVNHPTTGDIYSGGTTYSTSGLGLVSARQAASSGDADDAVGYLQKMNSAGTIQWSSYFNSSSNSRTTTVLCMEFNAAKTAIYFGGMTEGLASANLSTSGAYDNSQNGSRDFYVAKMALDQTFAYGTYVGSTADEDNMMGLNVDANDDVYIFGYTYATGTLFPTAGNPLQSTMAGGSRDKVFFKLETDLSALLYSTYYGGAADDSDPVGERGIKFSNCRIYTIVTAQSNDIPLTQGAVTTGKTSSTSIYEPALIVWANPPDLGNNTITQNQFVCNGATPAQLTGSTPTYELPTIIRNTTTSAHPSVGTASAYQWQVSTDQTNWTDILGATGINLTAAQMGSSTLTRYFRRIINGDACVLNNGNSIVTIAVFTISGTQVNNTCFGGTTGSIDVSIAGNSGTVTYNWGGGITTQDRTGLAQGTYTVTATAANGCTATASFTISQPTQIAFTPTPTNASCGASNGSITVTGVSGGSGIGYQYQLNNGAFQGGNTFSGLAGGTYNITVKDNAGCTRTIAVTVGSVNALSASVSSSTNPTCFGGNNGSVTITQTGGTSPYQYQLGSGSFQSSATFNNLAAGTYTVTVKDVNNCTTTVTFTLTQPTAPTINISSTVICEGSSVTISANPNGQTVTSYLWSNGATTPTITVSTPGVYWVSLISANGCTSNTDTVALNVNPAPNISLDTLINVACFGDSTGSINVDITTTIASCLAQPQTSPEGCTGCTSTASGNTNVTVLAGQKICITGSFTGQLTINTGGKAVICSNISPQSVNVNGGELYITSTGVLNANNFSGAAGSIIRNYGSIITNNFTTNGRFYNYGVVSCVGGFQIASSTGVFVNDGNFTCTGNFINYGVGMSNNSMQVGSQFTNAPGATFFNSCNLRIDSQFNCNSQFYNYGNILMDQSNTNATLPAGVTLVMGRGSYMICAQFNVHGTIAGPTGPCSQIVVTNQSRLFSGSVLSGYIQWADLDGNIENNNGTYGPNISFTNMPTCGNIPDVYTYSWSGPNGFAFTGPDPSNLPVGTYTITVTNSFGCSSTATFTITGPQSPVVVSISSNTNAACGGTNGSLTAVGSGGTPDYEYSINSVNFFPTGLFSGLAGGNYTITVRDSAGCTATVNATVGTNAGPSASITSRTNILCFGAATGAFTIGATGGTPGYQYQLDNGAFGNSNVFSGLTAGNYVVTVRDANGCTTTVNVSITQPNSAVSASIGSQTNVLCFGNATGSVTITATGGTPGYTYQLDNGAFGNSNVFSGLTAGTYVVTVKDANGCTTTVSVTITQPTAPLSASSSNQVNVLCYGNATGSFQVDATGGTAGYTYQLGNGAFGNSNVFSGLVAGTYVVTVKDANGCTTTVTVTITQPNAPLSASSSNQVNVLCYGNATGSFQVDATGGTASYTYQLGNGSFGNSNVFSGLIAGTYVVTVKDANGCTTTVSVTITQPNAPLSASSSNQVNVLCYGNATGSFQVDATGGTAGYTYQLGNGAFGNSNVFSGLVAGAYVVTVKDNNGCTTTVTVTITQPSAPLSASSSNQVNVLCYGNATGSFQIDAIGGTAGYTYQLDNGAFGNSNVFSGLVAGTYVVTVKDANGCTTTVTVTITQPNAPLSASSSNQVNVLCYGNATGSFQVDATGGTAGYTYQLGNGAFGNSNVFSGLVAGTYVVTVKDANGCTTTVSVTITQPNAPLSASSSNQVNVLCFGNATGSVTIAASGGTVGNGYQYQLGNGPLQLSPTFNGLIAGSYVVTVSDANGCIDTVNVIITQPNGGLTASSSNQVNILCFGDATGSFQIDALGGTPGYTYQLGNGAFGNSNVFSGLVAGTYVVTVKDASGCTTTVTVNITQPNAPLSASSSNQVNVLCYGNATGSFQIDATGGTTAYQYQLDNGAFGNSNVFSGLVAGTYVVTVKDANGCTTTVTVTITQPNAPLSASIDSQTNVLCFGNATGSVTISAADGTPGYTYQLGNGQFQLSPTFNGLTAGTYVITVKDANGCTTTVNVTITQPNAPLSASITNSVDVCFGYAVGSATVSPSGGTTPYTYSWNTIPAQSGATATGLAAGSYIVTVTDSNGCTTTASVTINSNAIPNAGGDLNVCEETADLVDAAQGQSWSAVAGNPANATVNASTGAVSGMTAGGTYLFALTSLFGCSDTVAVTTTSNCPIIANPDYVTTPEDSSITIDVPNNDTDPDGNIDNGSVTIIDPPNNGTVVVNPDGTIIYTPNPNYNGPDSLIYQICDTGMPVYCDTALVVIIVTPVNDPPIANQDTATTPEDNPIVIDVPDNDTDVDGNIDNGSVTIVDPPTNGTVVVNPDGTIIYTPNPNYNGPDTLIYQICDTGMPVLCDTALVIINVTPVNDPPVAVTDTATTIEDTPIAIDIDENDYDVDGNLDTNSVVIVIPPVNGNATFDPNIGEIIYVPNPNFFGIDSLLYQICDSLGLCDTAWVYITIVSSPDITLDPSIYPSGNNISCFGANDGSIDLTIDLGTPPYIISWTGPNGFTSSNEDISGLAPGTYTVTVTDLNGNIAQGSITLTEPTLLQGSGVVFSYNGGYNVSCGGQSPACDGSIDYTVTGGSPAYTVSWTGPNGFTANTQDISGLCAGTYTILVTDVNGCTVTNTYNLTAPPALDPTVVYANYNGYNVSCNGSCNGSINLTVNGGVAPFSYAWVGPNNFTSTSEDINNLCAGSYSVLVTDANGCTATVNVTLTQPPVLAASLLAATYNGGVNVSCANACDGSINATITGGVAPFSYAWTGPNGFSSTSEDISALCAGTYVLTVTDANGCTATQTITLTQPAPVAVSLAAALFNGGYNVSCVGSCNGSINATPSGGTAPYSYSWTGPNGFVAVTEDISTLCVGTYTLTVTDANGCTATQTITLTPPPALEVGGVAFEFNGGYNISCANACDGSIDLVINGGVAPFVVSWTGPNGFVSSSEDINNLCAGSYTVTVTDANGCISSQTITLTQPPVLSVSLQAALYNGEVNVSCANACDGSINATIGGGTTPYSYSWIGPNGFVAITQDLSNLCAGTYVLTVTDANGCTSNQTITLDAPDTLNATAVAAITDGGTNISCSGVCDGSIDLTITGGSQPYAISWVGPNGFVSTVEDISSLCVGTYVATIVDANGCTTSVTITLSQPPPVSSSGIVSTYTGGFNVGCNGSSNGSIDLTVTGGSGSYSYSWSGPNNFASSSQDVSGLVAGTYTVVITDVNGCSDTQTFNLTQPEVITTSATSSPSSCGQANGSINLSVAGGSGVFSYSWTGPNSFTANTQDLSGIVGGEYIVEVIDTNGCSVFDTINVTVKPPVAATGAVSNSTCNSSCNGAIDLTVTTGESPFTFAWSGPNSFSSSSEDISSLCQGNYIVIVTDEDGCSFADTFNIAAPEPVALTVTGLNAATCTASNGSISINPTGGSGGYSFSWTGPNGFTSSSQNLEGVAEGSYTVTVSDSLGCSHDQTVNVGSVSNLALTAAPVNVTCHGLNDGTACADATGATAPISYLWSTGDTTQCVDSLAPGTYIVAITDANGCAGSDTIVITEPELLAIAGDVLMYPNGYNVSVTDGTDGAIDISVTGGSGVYTYVWTIVGDSTAEDQLNLAADTYVVVCTDANGCIVIGEYVLEQPPIIELPTGFSPGNMDGMNDYYVIHGIDKLTDNKFTVFNRWGQVIFEKEGYQNDWAGTNQNGNMMPDGTYFVLFTVEVPGQGELTFKATVEQRQNLGK